jgi:hypothetical protein
MPRLLLYTKLLSIFNWHQLFELFLVFTALMLLKKCNIFPNWISGTVPLFRLHTVPQQVLSIFCNQFSSLSNGRVLFCYRFPTCFNKDRKWETKMEQRAKFKSSKRFLPTQLWNEA